MHIEVELELAGYRRTVSGNVEIAKLLDGASFYVSGKAEILPAIEPEDAASYNAACAALVAEYKRLAASVYMAELGAKGGAAKSEAKTRAVRENGEKGGRPRKNKE